MGVFAAFELQDEPDLVVALKEILGPAQLDIVIVLSGADAEFHFLHPGGGLGLAFLQLRLGIFVFPVIDDLANRRIRLAGNLDEIKPDGLGLGEGFP